VEQDDQQLEKRSEDPYDDRKPVENRYPASKRYLRRGSLVGHLELCEQGICRQLRSTGTRDLPDTTRGLERLCGTQDQSGDYLQAIRRQAFRLVQPRRITEGNNKHSC